MILLITPTGARPRQFELCVQWMRNQIYKGRVFWIIIDDCLPVTTDIISEDFRDNWTIIKKYPSPTWQRGMNTQGRNLQIAVNMIKRIPKSWIEAIFIIEDDDYYKPTYIEEMLKRLGSFDAIGQAHTIYYNVMTKGYKVNNNVKHASLFQTCFTIDALPVFESVLDSKFIDITFFQRMINTNVFEEEEQFAVGIKGLPGRDGIGMGHTTKSLISDNNCLYLQKLLGEDHKFYLNE